MAGALIALAGNGALNAVKLGGAASVTQIHGLSIDITGSVSMSNDISTLGTGSFIGGVTASNSSSVDHLAIHGDAKFYGGIQRKVNKITTDTVASSSMAGTTMILSHSAGAVGVTVPAAVGSGYSYHFHVAQVNTNNYTIKVANSDGLLKGSLLINDDDGTQATFYSGKGTDDTITLNGTTTGGSLGDTITLTDIGDHTYSVSGMLVVPAGSNIADPFSATV